MAGKEFEALIAADDKKVATLMDKLGLKKSK